MPTLSKLSALLLGATLVSACQPVPSAPDQASLCHVTDLAVDEVRGACTTGQKVLYTPERFGNVQLPVIFAALHCDHRHSIVWTEGAVSCIYLPSSLKSSTDAQAADKQ